MALHLERIDDKIEFFEASSLSRLEQLINEKIDHNRALLLTVHHISHQVAVSEKGTYYTAVVHFKAKK